MARYKRHCDAKPLLTLLDRWKHQLTTLAIDVQFPDSHCGALCDLLNSMTNLRRLSLGRFVHVRAAQLVPTLVRLELFAFVSREDAPVVFHNPGTNCTRLCHYSDALPLSEFRTAFNPRLFGQLTHLRLACTLDAATLRLLCHWHSVPTCYQFAVFGYRLGILSLGIRPRTKHVKMNDIIY